MLSRQPSLFVILGVLLGLCSACKEESVVVNVGAPEGELRVSEAALEQFIFRSYVDLIGTAPSQQDLASWSSRLRENELSVESRQELFETLQQSAEWREAYALNLYQSAKVRFLENFPDAEIQRRFIGQGDADDDARLQALLDWQANYLNGTATYRDLERSCIYNLVYDQINMGSFNFVRASFDNLLWRYPTDAEYDAGFAMVERSQQATLFGMSASDKAGYVDLLTDSEEALQGIVIWQFDQLLARRPSAAETVEFASSIAATGNLLELQQLIMQTNEYAGF